jgi:hypothetical protein
MKRPAFQFYPADWRKDAAVQSCSMGAKGLWHEMMCIMHECEPYGHLTVNGVSMDTIQLARLVGEPVKRVQGWLAELRKAGVFSETEDGGIFSRRMVKDETLRNIRADGGKAGSEHGAKGAEHGIKGGRPPASRGVKEPPLYPPPSSSSSSSSSELATLASGASALPTWAEGIEFPPSIPDGTHRPAWVRWIRHFADLTSHGGCPPVATVHAQLKAFCAFGNDAPKAVSNTIEAGNLRRLCMPRFESTSSDPEPANRREVA